MAMRAMMRLGLVVVTAALLAGCVASTATMQSSKLASYSGSIKHLIIIPTFAPEMYHKLGGDETKTFMSEFTKSLNACGVEVEFKELGPLSLENERVIKIDNFKGDSIMLLRWVRQQTGGHMPDFVIYLATIYDVAMRRAVWKAQIDFTSAWYGGQTLAAELVTVLKRDALIPTTCAPPKVPYIPF